MPSRSATICLNVVSWPWPWLMLPESIVTVPVRSKRISAPSKPAAAARSMVLDMPKPAQLAALLRFRPALGEARDVGELERQVHALLELAAVVGEGEAGLERHRLRRDVVLPPDLGRVHLQLGGGEIDHALDHVGRFRPAVAAIGPARMGVGEHRGRFHVHRGRAVDAGERAEIAGVGLEAGLQIGAGVDGREHAEAEEVAVLVERELGVGDVVARLRVGQKCFRARAHPFHRPAGQLGGEQHQRHLVVDRRLHAEAAADVAGDHAHLVLGHLEHVAWRVRSGRDARAAAWCRSCSGRRLGCSRRSSRAAPSMRW